MQAKQIRSRVAANEFSAAFQGQVKDQSKWRRVSDW